jgi:hypothetical protein
MSTPLFAVVFSPATTTKNESRAAKRLKEVDQSVKAHLSFETALAVITLPLQSLGEGGLNKEREKQKPNKNMSKPLSRKLKLQRQQ